MKYRIPQLELAGEVTDGMTLGCHPECDVCITDYGLGVREVHAAFCDTISHLFLVPTNRRGMVLAWDPLSHEWHELDQSFPVRPGDRVKLGRLEVHFEA